MDDDAVLRICDTIRETSLSLHRFLRHGHLEKVYENGLVHRLRKAGLNVQAQFPISVFDEDGTMLGHYIADIFVEHVIIIELKACQSIAPEHVAQVLGYLRATGVRHGMLINFGSPKIFIRKYVL